MKTVAIAIALASAAATTATPTTATTIVLVVIFMKNLCTFIDLMTNTMLSLLEEVFTVYQSHITSPKTKT